MIEKCLLNQKVKKQHDIPRLSKQIACFCKNEMNLSWKIQQIHKGLKLILIHFISSPNIEIDALRCV